MGTTFWERICATTTSTGLPSSRSARLATSTLHSLVTLRLSTGIFTSWQTKLAFLNGTTRMTTSNQQHTEKCPKSTLVQLRKTPSENFIKGTSLTLSCLGTVLRITSKWGNQALKTLLKTQRQRKRENPKVITEKILLIQTTKMLSISTMTMLSIWTKKVNLKMLIVR